MRWAFVASITKSLAKLDTPPRWHLKFVRPAAGGRRFRAARDDAVLEKLHVLFEDKKQSVVRPAVTTNERSNQVLLTVRKQGRGHSRLRSH